jgi:HEAT repeat protein
MRFVSGFDDEILEALDSDDAEVHYHAVCAAGNWEVDAAWSHIADLVASDDTDKSLRLAAIEAMAGIRPRQAVELLVDLTDLADDDIVDAAYEALAVARGLSKVDLDESLL